MAPVAPVRPAVASGGAGAPPWPVVVVPDPLPGSGARGGVAASAGPVELPLALRAGAGLSGVPGSRAGTGPGEVPSASRAEAGGEPAAFSAAEPLAAREEDFARGEPTLPADRGEPELFAGQDWSAEPERLAGRGDSQVGPELFTGRSQSAVSSREPESLADRGEPELVAVPDGSPAFFGEPTALAAAGQPGSSTAGDDSIALAGAPEPAEPPTASGPEAFAGTEGAGVEVAPAPSKAAEPTGKRPGKAAGSSRGGHAGVKHGGGSRTGEPIEVSRGGHAKAKHDRDSVEASRDDREERTATGSAAASSTDHEGIPFHGSADGDLPAGER
ncbi:MAG TPA: hypothetical protein VGL47_30365 [Amycolatopsis sp.]|uniref:Uncharacterized protein n=1 Tax=Amycolatopsis nalaikhensis TaxID=715472 RepID=A0ABY8XQZ5_9PSEU|nr:hypothetical protein [Amycolatopsis sp. 2-2]WIV58089.1 hypothetical protein QP939_05320 [Amycolatopsis sp. 2-2]